MTIYKTKTYFMDCWCRVASPVSPSFAIRCPGHSLGGESTLDYRTTPWIIQGVVVDGKVMGSVFKEDKYAGRETKVVKGSPAGIS